MLNGRSDNTPVHTHAYTFQHKVYQKLTDGNGEELRKAEFYCMPDNYKIEDGSLNDLVLAYELHFSQEKVSRMDENTKLKRDYFGNSFLPGYVSLKDLGNCTGVNATVNAISNVPKLRDWFLLKSELNLPLYRGVTNCKFKSLLWEFGKLVRIIWSDNRLRSVIEPASFMKVIEEISHSKYKVGGACEAGEFWVWLVSLLHKSILKGMSKRDRKGGCTVITECFAGVVNVQTTSTKAASPDTRADDDLDDRVASDDEGEGRSGGFAKNRGTDDASGELNIVTTTNAQSTFFNLTLEIPQKPLFKDDSAGGLVIPSETISNLLNKFDGKTYVDGVGKDGKANKKIYKISRLPEYLVFRLVRFKKTKFAIEKNPTIVTFPIDGMDMTRFVFDNDGGDDDDEVDVKSSKKMKLDDEKSGSGPVGEEDKAKYKYRLISNISHSTPPTYGRETSGNPITSGTHICMNKHAASKQWFQIEEDKVNNVITQMVGIGESLLLVFQREHG